MTDSTSFEFGELLAATRLLHQDLRGATAGSPDPRVRALTRDLDELRIAGASSDEPPLTIAFVGQYDAGKSTILRVLTGRDDIAIDADVSTREVTAYDWRGVQLLDTPGVHAGYPDHDERTHAAIERASLLVYVVTNELFDPTIGRHFRGLAFDRQHAMRMLLVINKMGQGPGSPEIMRPDLEKVTAPLTLSDFRTVFIDARTWLEAQDADDEDRADLLAVANIGALTEALDGFVTELGFTGRLSAPLFTMRGVAEQAAARLSTDSPEEHAALELLHRKRSLLLASRGRLRTTMGGVIARAVADIGTYGDEVAEAIEPGKTEHYVEALHARAQARAIERSAALAQEARTCVEAELGQLHRQLEALRDGVLARELIGQLEHGHPGDVSFDDSVSPVGRAGWSGEVFSDWPARARKVGDVAKGIGTWAARWATGPAAGGASTFGTAAARGSSAHKAVYDIGKFFGVKFKPWGAVNVARAIGTAGRVISTVGAVLAVVGQIAEDRQQDQHRLRLRDARAGVRSAYRESAVSVQATCWEQFESFVADFYDSELLAVDEIVGDLVGKRGERTAGADAFRSLEQRATKLIEHISTKRLMPPAA